MKLTLVEEKYISCKILGKINQGIPFNPAHTFIKPAFSGGCPPRQCYQNFLKCAPLAVMTVGSSKPGQNIKSKTDANESEGEVTRL